MYKHYDGIPSRCEMTNIKMTVTEAINFRLNTEMIANLKRLARHVSYHLNDDYTYVDLIRCLLADNFPIPATNDVASEQLDAAVEMCSRISKPSASAGVTNIPVTFTSSTVDGKTSTFTYNVSTIKPDEDAKSSD